MKKKSLIVQIFTIFTLASVVFGFDFGSVFAERVSESVSYPTSQYITFSYSELTSQSQGFSFNPSASRLAVGLPLQAPQGLCETKSPKFESGIQEPAIINLNQAQDCFALKTLTAVKSSSVKIQVSQLPKSGSVKVVVVRASRLDMFNARSGKAAQDKTVFSSEPAATEPERESFGMSAESADLNANNLNRVYFYSQELFNLRC